jgi:hypothetical protein
MEVPWVSTQVKFNYYYGDESNQFSFYRIPRQLIIGKEFRNLSTDAKLLYGLLLDRMGLSARNGWYDELGRVYIYYTAEEIRLDMCCGNDKALKLLAELDTKKGIGLIERVKQGQGKPTKIYVKRFTTGTPPVKSIQPEPPGPGADLDISDFQTSEKPMSRPRQSRGADLGKADASYIKSNQTDISYPDPSIYPHAPPGRWIDRSECRRTVQRNVDYSALCSRFGYDDVESAVELITDVLCSTRPTLRIGGEAIPAAQAQERFASLDSGHLEYVFDCLRRNTTRIHNIRAYWLTALYNAPITMSCYYQAEVQHDFG